MSDHNLLVAKMKLKIKRTKKSIPTVHYDLDLLKQQHYRELFSVEVKNRYDALLVEETEQLPHNEQVDHNWEKLKESIHAAVTKVLPKKKAIKDKPWMNQEILDLMAVRQQNKNKEQYNHIDKEIKRKCKIQKEAWYNQQCDEVESLEKEHRTRELHQKVKQMTDKRRHINVNSGCIKDKNGKLLFDRKDVGERWQEYIEELYDDPNRDEAPPETNCDWSPELMKEEVVNAIKLIKDGKAAGIDKVQIEHFKALEGDALNIVIDLCQTIYKSGHLPKDLKHSTFIKLPKKQNAQECAEHRTISLMSHMVKIILKVISERNRRKFEDQIGETQMGFREGK